MADDDEELPAYLTRGRRRAARRRFLAGGGSALAAMATVPLLGATGPRAAAQDARSSLDGQTGPADATAELPPYVERSGWGADERLRRDADGRPIWPVAFFPAQAVTVHHTGGPTPADDDEAAGLVADIYREHAVELGYGDIGYHLLIGPEGTVFEGRWSGGTNFPVFETWPDRGGGAGMVTAAHVHNHNAGNLGVALVGDFTDADTTDAAWWSLTVVVALLTAAAGLDAVGTARYRNPVNGLARVVPTVSGHEDWTWTGCPGAGVSDWLPQFREAAAGLAPGLGGTWFA